MKTGDIVRIDQLPVGSTVVQDKTTCYTLVDTTAVRPSLTGSGVWAVTDDHRLVLLHEDMKVKITASYVPRGNGKGVVYQTKLVNIAEKKV